MKPRIELLISKLTVIARRYWVKSVIALAAILGGVIVWGIFAPQTIVFDYSQPRVCVSSPRLLPSSASIDQRGSFEVYRPAGLSVGSLALYSSTVCVRPVAAPKERSLSTYREKQFGLGLLSRNIVIKTTAYAQFVSNETTLLKEIPPDKPLTERLTAMDRIFNYIVRNGDRQANCHVRIDRMLDCDIQSLNLTYAERYDLQVIRQYKGRTIASLPQIPVKTITPISVTATSIVAGAVIQDKPTEILIVTDKKITELGSVQLIAKGAGGTEIPIAGTPSLADKGIRLRLAAELARKTTFELRLAGSRAADSSGFVGNAYSLHFATSGGPKVTTTNIGTRDVGFHQSIVLTFDQVLLATQNAPANVSLQVNGAAAGATMSISGNKITVQPATAFPVCATIKLTVSNNIQNQFGVSGDSTWSHSSRASCYTTFSIGSSVQGRALTAYKFGTGPSSILYLGAMHGSEANSRQLMQEWIAELNRNPERIPAHRSLIIIPSVNPDGVARNSRYNARNVDLNRNFPANDWKSVVTSPYSKTPTPAGGPAPLSEPESQAVAHYIGQLGPILVMSFHSKAAIVEANEAGNSVSVAAAYASRSGYRAVPKSQSAPVFQYDTTGAMEDWLRDKSGRVAIVVELASSTSSEFGRNKNALWYTAGL